MNRKLITRANYFRSPTGSSTLPRPTSKATEADLIRSDKPNTTASTTSLYDNVAPGNQQGENLLPQRKSARQGVLSLIDFSRHSSTSKVRHEHDDSHCFGWNSTEPRRSTDKSRRRQWQADAEVWGNLQVWRDASWRNVATSKAKR